jgi:hypothetical protein
MRVFVHTGKGMKGVNKGYDFLQIPAVGEFVNLSESEPDGNAYRVNMVEHCPLNSKKKGKFIYDAEIWVSAENHAKALRAAGAI